jgi:hypothetical protein
MTDLPMLEWEPDEYSGAVKADIGVLELVVESDPLGWAVHWRHDWVRGDCASCEDGKLRAVACAREILLQGIETIARGGR